MDNTSPKTRLAASLTLALLLASAPLVARAIEVEFVTKTDGATCKSTAVYIDGAYASCVTNNDGDLGGEGLQEHECLGWCTPAIIVDPGTGGLDDVVEAVSVDVTDAADLGGSGHVAIWVDESDIAQAISDLEAAGFIIEDHIM